MQLRLLKKLTVILKAEVASMITLTQQNFFEVAHQNGFVLVDFWANWCGPCKTLAPVLEELSKEFSGRIIFAKLDIEEFSELAEEYNVISIPTLIMFEGGEEISRIVGAYPKEALRTKIERMMH